MTLPIDAFYNHTDPPDIYQQIAQTLGEQGWCVTTDFLPPLLVSQIKTEASQSWQSGEFRHAGVGRGASFEVNKSIRTDQVLWLDNEAQSGARKVYFNILEQLRLAINRTLYLGLMEYEAHFAIYPPNSYYKKHLDQFRGMGTRTVTAIVYLNEDWQAEHGGQLRLYNDANDPQRYLDVFPNAGTLVTFMSARYLHEVLPANRDRISITGWFKRNPG